MPLTAAERQKKRREKLRSSPAKFAVYQEKSRMYRNKHKAKKSREFSKLTEEDRVKQLELKRLADRARQWTHRENKIPKTPNEDSPRAYSAKYSLSRATNRAKSVLPKSPRKRKAVIRSLIVDFGVQQAGSMQRNPRIDRLAKETVTNVKVFYQRDDISRMAPGKRDVVTVRDENGKHKLQKRHLVMSIKETHAVFMEENPTFKIGVSKFAELRPVNVLLSSETPANVCTCIYHENLFMGLDAMHKLVLSMPTYNKDFPSSCLVSAEEDDCWFSECTHDECGFEALYPLPGDETLRLSGAKWMVWQEIGGRMSKQEREGTVADLHAYICSIMPKFLKHCLVKRKQAKSYETDKGVASEPGSVIAVLQMDYAENYTCIAQDEIQSAHWNQAQVTLFTSVTWFRGNVNSQVIVSDYMRHEKTSSIIFLDEILQSKPKPVQEIRIWTDGPASQFKNKFVMAAFQVLSQRHGVKLVWNFSATSHGKGPVDGVGAALKRSATHQVKTRQCIINNATDFHHAVQQSNIKVSFVSAESVNERASSLDLDNVFTKALSIKGISSFHYIQPMGTTYQTRRYTAEGNRPDHCGDRDPQEEDIDQPVGNDIAPPPRFILQPGQIVAVRIPGKRPEVTYIYLAQVMCIDDKDVGLRYLRRFGSVYQWPAENDESWQPIEDILCTMTNPNLLNNRGQLSFPEDDIDNARNTALSRPNIETVCMK